MIDSKSKQFIWLFKLQYIHLPTCISLVADDSNSSVVAMDAFSVVVSR